MTAVGLVSVYALLMSVWWTLMKSLLHLRRGDNQEIFFPNNLIRLASGFGAGIFFAYILYQHGGLTYLRQLPRELWFWLTGHVLLGVGISYCLLKAMEKSVASIAVHVTMLAPIAAVVTAFLFGVDNWPGWFSGFGIAAVLVGLYVLHYDPLKYNHQFAGPLKDIWQHRGKWLGYAIVVALLGGCALPIEKRCVQLSGYVFAPSLSLFLSWGVTYSVLAWQADDFRKMSHFSCRRVWLSLILMALLFGLANVFQGAAYNHHHAAAVGSLKRLDAPLTVLWAYLFFPHEERREGNFFWRIVGSALALVGAGLIGLDRDV